MRRSHSRMSHSQRTRRGRRKQPFFRRLLADIRNYPLKYLILGGGGLLITAGIVCLFVFVIFPPEADVPAQEVTGQMEEELPVPSQEILDDDAEQQAYQEQLESGEMDEETLAGLLGEGVEDDVILDETKDILSVGLLLAPGSEDVITGFAARGEERIAEADSGLGRYYVYTLGEDPNQQIQDIRSLFNTGCRAVVTAGLSDSALSVVDSLARKYEVPVVSVGEQDQSRVSVVAEDAGLAALMQQQGIPDQGILLACKNQNSAFARNILEAYPGAAVASQKEDNFLPVLVSQLSQAQVLVIETGLGTEVLGHAADAGVLPPMVATQPTAAFVKKWQDLRTTGIPVTPKEEPQASKKPDNKDKDKDKDQPEETAAPQQMFVDSKAQLLAYVPVGGETLGRTAFEFAYQLAVGNTPHIRPNFTYRVDGGTHFTNDQLAEYYEKAQNMPDARPFGAGAPVEDIKHFFIVNFVYTPPETPAETAAPAESAQPADTPQESADANEA